MRLGGYFTAATLASSAMLLALLGTRLVGVPVPALAVWLCAALSLPLTTASAIQQLVYAWRGPPILTFSRVEAVRCAGAEADAIRAAAQLRGTLGGAGHIHRSRLLLHAAACLAVAALAIFSLATAGTVTPGAWLLAVVAGTGLGAMLLPARPFFYREAMHGEVLVSPPLARSMLVWARPDATARAGVEPPAPGRDADGRGNSPSSVPTAPRNPDAGARAGR
jgi:hypothetical protein